MGHHTTADPDNIIFSKVDGLESEGKFNLSIKVEKEANLDNKNKLVGVGNLKDTANDKDKTLLKDGADHEDETTLTLVTVISKIAMLNLMSLIPMVMLILQVDLIPTVIVTLTIQVTPKVNLTSIMPLTMMLTTNIALILRRNMPIQTVPLA